MQTVYVTFWLAWSRCVQKYTFYIYGTIKCPLFSNSTIEKSLLIIYSVCVRISDNLSIIPNGQRDSRNVTKYTTVYRSVCVCVFCVIFFFSHLSTFGCKCKWNQNQIKSNLKTIGRTIRRKCERVNRRSHTAPNVIRFCNSFVGERLNNKSY